MAMNVEHDIGAIEARLSKTEEEIILNRDRCHEMSTIVTKIGMISELAKQKVELLDSRITEDRIRMENIMSNLVTNRDLENKLEPITDFMTDVKRISYWILGTIMAAIILAILNLVLKRT